MWAKGQMFSFRENSFPQLYRCYVSLTTGHANEKGFIWERQPLAGIANTGRCISISVLFLETLG